MTPKAAEPVVEPGPTLREIKATLTTLFHEIYNYGPDSQIGRECARAYEHMSWLLDAYLFDTDPYQDDGGRS